MARRSRAQLQAAVEHYSAAIERFGDFPEAYENRAYIVMQFGHLDHAIRGWEKAVELAPFRFQAWQNLAQAYRQKGDAARAEQCARRAAAARDRAIRMPWVQ